MESSPSDSVMVKDPQERKHEDQWTLEERRPEVKTTSTLNVIISGLALFSDGYNVQISTSCTIENDPLHLKSS